MLSRARLSVLGGAQVCGDGVVLDGLVEHQSQQTCSVGHGRPQIPLLLKQLIQFVPLRETEDMRGHERTQERACPLTRERT